MNTTMDDEGYFEKTSFQDALIVLRSKSRDPLSSRIASVTAAITDVLDEENVTPGQVYASAVTTLEGLLKQETTLALLDSLYNQAALLRILATVVPHVAPSTLQATLALTSRVLRAIVSYNLLLVTKQNDDTNEPIGQVQQRLLETKDGLSATHTVLSAACAATGEVLRRLPPTMNDTMIRPLLNGTLMLLLQDSTRPKTQSVAKNIISGLLLSDMRSSATSCCHPIIMKFVTKHVYAVMDRYLKHPSDQGANTSMMDVMGLLNPTLVAMDFTSIGERLMTIMMQLFQEESNVAVARPIFVTRSHGATLHILTINAILSTILSLLESSNEDEDQKYNTSSSERNQKLDAFASRVLASLIQTKCSLVFREGVADLDLLESGRLIIGQVLLSAAQRLLRSNTEETKTVGAKLLPLVFQQLLELSRPFGNNNTKRIGDSLFVEVSQLIRTDLSRLHETNVTLHVTCSKVCVQVLQSVVHDPFDDIYSPVLKPLALVLQQMPVDDPAVVQTIMGMVQIRCDPKLRDQVRKTMDLALVCLVEGIGIEAFWAMINFTKLCTDMYSSKKESVATISNKYAWIFEVMKGSGVGGQETRLAFFQTEVLSLARKFDTMFVQSGSSNIAFRFMVINLWGLFPTFCRHPADLESAVPNLVPILVKAMNDERYPEFVPIVCNGIDVLSNGIIQRKNVFQELIEEDVASELKREVEVVRKASVSILPSLFKLVDLLHEKRTTSDADVEMDLDAANKTNEDSSRIAVVTKSVASIAKLSPKPQIQNLFSKVVQRILQTSQANGNEKIEKLCSLLSLAQALVVSECLEEASIALLYRSLKPLIRTDETPPRVQKRAYKLLCEICKRYHFFIAEPERLKAILDLLSNTSMTSQIAARFMRLKALTLVIEGLGGSPQEDCQRITTPLVGETLLCLKDSNAKTRDAAYKLLLTMAKVHDDLAGFIQVVTAAMGSSTSHVRSAAVTGLARLVFEFSSDDPSVQNLVPSILKTVLILSDDTSREVTKSMIVFVRVAVVAASAEQLEPLLPNILNGLLKYHRGKDRFRAKIKIIIKKLVKMFGYDALMPFVPPSDIRLLTHMRKLSERETRRRQSQSYQAREERVDYDKMIDSDEEDDSDCGLTLVSGMTRKSRLSHVTSRTGKNSRKRNQSESVSLGKSTKSAKGHVSVRIKNDADGEILDVQDLKRVTFAESEDEDDSDDDIEFDSSGKLVVHDADDRVSNIKIDNSNDLLSLRSKRSVASHQSEDGRCRKDKKSKQDGRKAMTRLGQAYKAKRAGGDFKKQGQKYEPYAYVQLDGRNYSKKNRHQAVEQMGFVVQNRNKRQRKK